MKDWWRFYDALYDDIQARLPELVGELPAVKGWLQKLTPAQLGTQARRDREVLRLAVEGNWEPQLAAWRAQGPVFAALEIPFAEWFELIGAFQKQVLPPLVHELGKDPERLARALASMAAYVNLAMGSLADAYLAAKETIIRQQQQAIHELSTPVLQVRERLLLIPIVGVLDTQRARQLTESLLHSIREHRAKVVVIDITGVPAVDSKVANHLFQTVAAVRLMGARSIVTGLSAEVAQALVVIGVDVDKLNTAGDLQGGLEEANALLGRGAEPAGRLEIDGHAGSDSQAG